MAMESVLERARRLAEDYCSKLLPDSAVFWAEKAILLSGGEVDDVILYCQSLYASGQYKRAAHYLQNSTLLSQSSALRYLAARCLAACKAWEEVIGLLQSNPMEEMCVETGEDEKEDIPSKRLGNVTAPTHVLLGKAYEFTGNTQEAIICYKDAILEDIYCVEALERLYSMHALPADDEQSLMSNLPTKQCSIEEEMVLKYLYQSKLHHHDKVASLPQFCQTLANSIDVQCNIVTNFLQHMNIEKCSNQTAAILQKDPYHMPTLLVCIACCVINKSTKKLYALGHDLVKHFPELPLAWYAVSSYYYAAGKQAQTRRYLAKAINLDPHFAPAHVAFGLSFASEGEHDQAIAAFSHAARYMRASYIPLMYLGKEYFVTGNLPIATSFFKNALTLAPNNPALFQEIGLVLASTENHVKAEKYFTRAIFHLQKFDPHVTLPTWEPVYNNLGHVLRKQNKFTEALDAHMKALQLVPNEPSTLSAIGFVYLLMEDYTNVVQYCNQSLRLRREDRFTIEILQIAVNELATVPLKFVPFSDLTFAYDIYSKDQPNNTSDLLSGSSPSSSAMQTD